MRTERPLRFLTESSANRYAIGSISPGLHWNDDVSFNIYIQRESPGADKESNWLPPTPEGALFRIILRTRN